MPIDIGHLRDCGSEGSRMNHDDKEEIDFEEEQFDELGNVACYLQINQGLGFMLARD